MLYLTHSEGRRAGERNAADELQAMYEASAHRHREKKRRANAALWYTHYSALAASLRRSADGYERRAERLLEEPGEGGGRQRASEPLPFRERVREEGLAPGRRRGGRLRAPVAGDARRGEG